MRIALCLALACAALVGGVSRAFAQATPHQAFEAGAAAYRAGDYAQADELWTSLVAVVPPVPLDFSDLLFNLGNCAYRRGAPIEALGWYRACAEIDPRRRGLAANTALAAAKAGLDNDRGSEVSATLERWLTRVTAGESAWAALLASLGAAACVVAWRWAGWVACARAAIALSCLAALAAVPCAVRAFEPQGQRWFVRSPSAVSVCSEPREDSARMFELAPCATVRGIERNLDWLKVELDGRRGWVPLAKVMPIEAPFVDLP